MAIQNLITNKITDGVDKPLTNGQWQDATGLEVEDFVSSRLQKSIATFSFSNETSELTGYNSDGEEVCRTTVINATPNYVPEIEIVNLRINSNNNSLKNGENIDLNQPSIIKVEAGIRLKVSYDILGKTYYGIDPQKVEFTLGKQTIVVDRVTPNDASDLEAVKYVDITSLFQEGIYNGTLTASCATKDYEDSDSYDGLITLRKIVLSYTNKGYIEGKIMTFNIAGLSSNDLSKFRLVYYLDGSMTKMQLDNLTTNTYTDLELTTGVHQIYARLEAKADANLYYSNWVQTNVIVDCMNIKGNAVAVINSVPTEIDNCSNALLYKICYAPGTNGGDIVINSYISENYDDIEDQEIKKNHILNSTTISLMSGEDPGEKEFYSYFELETVSSSDSRFIGFDINGQTVYSYEGSAPDILPYFYINIVENKYNVNNAFNYTSGAVLNYSQINGSGSNVFISDNLNTLPGDGWTVDGRYTAYQVSASDQNLFKTPIDLISYLNNGFTFEFLLKTYNVNGEDPVIKIGNLHLGPGYVRVNEDIEPGKQHANSSIHVNSKADYGKEEITHVLITYTKGYKPQTYLEIYNQLLSQGQVNYSSPNAVSTYDVLKVYVNGVINREIQVSPETLKRNGEFKLQIAPTTSDIKFYGVRTYNFPFNYAQVQKNYISSILDANDKKIFYDKNDILDDSGKISLKKCINKYNVIVYAIPETDCPLYYGNKDTAGDEGSNTSVLVHYANPDWSNYNVKMWGGKYKAQGSSAKKYLIHNCQYNIKKGCCLTEAEFAHNVNNNLKEGDEGYIAPRKYYVMPETNIEAKKFVGKVNYASSMQTHKQGACDLFDGAYKSIFQNNLDEKMPTGGRKAVIEKEFLYFYYNLKPGETLETITINDTLEDARFMGFQTWGPGKADDPTYGYSDDTPEYILMEGADNGNSGANFKIPWAAMQTYDSTVANIGTQYISQQPAAVTKVDYTTGLLIDDETIKFTASDDPLDVDYGVEEYEGYHTDSNLVFRFPDVVRNTSLKRFVEFYNAMYQYDFSCYLSMNDVGATDTFDVTSQYVSEKYPKGVTKYKLFCSKNSMTVTGDPAVTTINRFDVLRWDALRSKWVHAGLHMNDTNTTWEKFNLLEQFKAYKNSDLYLKYNQEMDENIRNKFDYTGSITTDNNLLQYVFPTMKEMFIAACKEYTDYQDIAYHQAVIRVLSGTDNRAKNTYFQIIGKIYENGEPTERGDYKIRLMQDDLDTIFATDNNGQQLKPYYLLEPPFNLDLESMWGDQHSSFFYPFDLCFSTLINDYTGRIIDYLLGSSASITSESTKLQQFFLRIQQTLPAIAYNHTAEIYYELAQTLMQGGNKLYEVNFGEILAKYANNSVPDPLSLSHGSNYEGEVQFLKNRMILLASLTGKASGLQRAEQLLANEGTGGAGETITVAGNATYLDYFYPNYRTANNLSLLLSGQNDGVINYDTQFARPYTFPNPQDKIIVQSLAVPNNSYSFTLSGQLLTGFFLSNVDKYGHLEITKGLQFLKSLPSLPRVSQLVIDGKQTDYQIGDIEIEVYKHLPVIESLSLTNVIFNNSTLDFRNCNRLEELDLRGCSGLKAIILPEGSKLKRVYLPSCLKSLAILNNPQLENLYFEDGSKLTSLTLNCEGVGSINVSEVIQSSFDFSNAVLLKLIGGCDLDVEVVESMSILHDKCDLFGKYRVVQNGITATISYMLKKNLVSMFGNIDSESNSVYFEYTKKPLNSAYLKYEEELSGFRFVAGSDNIYYPFDSIYFTDGNGINIKSDGTLDIVYTSNIPAGIGSLDSDTGALELFNNSTSFYDFTVTFNASTSSSIKAEGKIYIGYRQPEVGDYAYADGTFSPSLTKTKTLVGLVYAKRKNPTNPNGQIDLAILSNQTITDIIAPDFYAYNSSTFDVAKPDGEDQQKIFNVLQSVFVGGTFSPNDSNPAVASGYSYSPYSVTPNAALPVFGDDNYQLKSNYAKIDEFPERSGKANTLMYKTVANHHLTKLALADASNFGQFMRNQGYMNDSLEVINNFDGTAFDTICTQFNARTGQITNRPQGPLSVNSYAQIMYPAFYKASIFEPQTTGVLKDCYKAGNWYVPSIDEMSLLIAHRIISTTSAYNPDDSVSDWYRANSTYHSDGLFNPINKETFKGFLTGLGSTNAFAYITSDVVGFKNAVYTITTIHTGDSVVGWKAQYPYSAYRNGYISNTSDSTACRRNQSYTVPLCCQVTVNSNE